MRGPARSSTTRISTTRISPARDRDPSIGAHLAGENAFTYGLLYEREAHRAERL